MRVICDEDLSTGRCCVLLTSGCCQKPDPRVHSQPGVKVIHSRKDTPLNIKKLHYLSSQCHYFLNC